MKKTINTLVLVMVVVVAGVALSGSLFTDVTSQYGPSQNTQINTALDALEAERDDLRPRLAVAHDGCCPDCGGSGIGADVCEGPDHHTPPCPSCEGSGLAPGAREMAAQRNVARAERDAALARVTELEAPGECQSLHKLRAEVARLEAELAKPVAEAR